MAKSVFSIPSYKVQNYSIINVSHGQNQFENFNIHSQLSIHEKEIFLDIPSEDPIKEACHGDQRQ